MMKQAIGYALQAVGWGIAAALASTAFIVAFVVLLKWGMLLVGIIH